MAVAKTKKNNKNFKPVYKKKKDKTPKVPISNQDHAIKNPEFKPTIVQPSEKYLKTLKCIRAKKYFVDAQFGNKVFWESILEFHVDKKDVPVLLCDAKYRNKKGDLVNEKKVYRIVRYNDKEIIGMVSTNINPWMSKTVDITVLKQEEEKEAAQRVARNNHRNNNGGFKKRPVAK